MSIEYRECAHGLVALLPLGPPETADDLFATLPEAERALGAAFVDKRRHTFAAGRIALRAALAKACGLEAGAILRDDRGAPILPNGVRGSISHCNTVACAIVARPELEGHVGIDIEAVGRAGNLKPRLILTPLEEESMPEVADPVRALELALKFSLKEALYKGLDPFVRRWVGFKEVEAWIEANGRAEFAFHLKNDEGPFFAEGAWERVHDLVLTTVHVARTSR